jgi:hypothetical protein
MRKLLLVLTILLLLWGGVLLLGRTVEQRQLNAAWPVGLGPVESVPQRYPDHPMNASAQRLVALAGAAGIDLVPGAERRRMPIDAVAKEIHTYVESEMAHAGTAPVAPPPQPVVAYLARRDAVLNELQQHLITAPVAEWPQKIAAADEAPLPNLMGQMQLVRVLVTTALLKRDWNALHAGWKLEQQLHSRPELISQLVGIAMVRMINAAARSMPLPEPAWMAELRARDYKRATLAALQAESWTAQQIYAGSGRTAGPYLRMSWADLNAGYIEAVGAMATGSECAVGGGDLGKRVVGNLAWWNQIGKMAVPNLGAAFHRVARLRVELEATEKLALAKQGRFDGRSRCSDGAWTIEKNVLRFTKPLPRLDVDFRIPIDLPVPAPPQST